MTINLINVLRKSFSEKSYKDISEHTGISTESTKNGVNAIIPAVLACILGNNTLTSATQPTWWNALRNEYPYTEDEFIETETINSPSFLVKGREVLSGMFRTSYDDLVKSVGTVAGVPKNKAAGLIEVSVPLIVAYLNNWAKRKEWKFKDLIGNLIETKSSIVAELPTGITPSHLGVNDEAKASSHNIPRPVLAKHNVPKDDFSETIESEIPTNEVVVKKNKNGLIWVLGLIVLALLLWYLLGNKACVRNVEGDIIVPGVSDTISELSLHEHTKDGTYYAYQMKSELDIKELKE